MAKRGLMFILALLIVLSGSAIAQNKGVADIYEAAEKEGEVSWACVLREKEAAPFVKAFQKEYPKIKVNFQRQHGGDAMERLLREYQAGQLSYDVVHIHPDSMHEFLKVDAIEKINWAELGVLPKMIQPGGRFIGPFETPFCILYNTNLIKPEDVPKSWEDLLDPKWKGKITTDTRPSGFLRLTGEWGPEKVLDYLRKFGENKPTFVRGQTETVTLMAAGEHMLAAPYYLHSYVEISEKKGGPIGYSLPNPLPTSFYHYGIIKGAKHPNAGRVFMAWLGSKGYKLMDGINWGRAAPFDGTKKEKLYEGITLSLPPSDEQVPDRHKYTLEMTRAMGARK